MSILHKHELSRRYQSLFNRFGVNNPLALAHFLGQMEAESQLKPISENLNYSASRLRQVFPKYFPTLDIANAYAHNPQKIANRIYANRMGNGDEKSGDGWRYRGRGFIQLTGKDNYRMLTNFAKTYGMQVDYVKNPDLLLNEADALISALWYWQSRNINAYAVKDDILAVSRIINVGNAGTKIIPHGMDNRRMHTAKYKRLFTS